MREIKFRAWDENRSEFVDIDYWQIKGLGNMKRVVFMQYTGLKDKNGKEIYEGDLVLQQNIIYSPYHPNNDPEIVVFSDGVFCLTNKSGLIKESNLLNMVLETVEVIGNMYDNPELLK